MKKVSAVTLIVISILIWSFTVAFASDSSEGFTFFDGLITDAFSQTAALTKDDTPTATIDKLNFIVCPSLGILGISGENNGEVIRSKLWTSIEPKQQMSLLLQVCTNYEEYIEQYGPITIPIVGLYNDSVTLSSVDEVKKLAEKMEADEDYWLKCFVSVPGDNSSVTVQSPSITAEFEPVNVNKVSFSADEWMSTPYHRAVFATLMIVDFYVDFKVSQDEGIAPFAYSVFVGKSKEDNTLYMYFASGKNDCILVYFPGHDFETPCYGLGFINWYFTATSTNPKDNILYSALMEDQCDVIYEVTPEEMSPIISLIADGYQ